jgi:biopolymer transport protein ExbD
MNLSSKKRRNKAEMQVSAMNDIMFFLLLFFLIASTVTNPNVIKLSLPKANSGKSISKKTITVSITADLKYYVEKKPVAEADLQNTLGNYSKQAEQLTIVLYVEKTVPIQNVVSVLDIAQKLNIKLVLATVPK